MPKWVHNADADPIEKERWYRYYKDLVDPENGHKELTVEAENKIEQMILEMYPSRNCTILKSEARRLGRSVVDEYNARSAKYDMETDHGGKEGAMAP